MTSKNDLYVILEVGRTASVNDIKRAFRKLARRYHPDINPGDRHAEDLFKRITEAYDILSNPLKREFYDVNGFYTDGVLEAHDAKAEWGFSFQGFNFSKSSHSEFSEIFGQVFAGRAVRRQAERGQDLEYQVSISFDESLRALNTRIGLLRSHPCDACEGSGQAAGSRDTACSGCSGTGKTTRSKGHLQFAITCSDCGGSGRFVKPCIHCGGEGRLSGSESLDVALPAGVSTGTRIRVSGKGDAGKCGGPAGDLFVVVNVAEHSFFRRMGDNIHCSVPLTVTEAALGTKIEVPTVDGLAFVRIPPGTQTGQTFRMRGKGAPSLLNPGLRGDQYVEVKVIVPRIADERSKEILRELAKLNPEDPRKDLK
ncbi:MAG TPA: molecular chaperone DnaJ [Terriglobia bacterium]|jgi:molecular chaperone DnaJ